MEPQIRYAHAPDGVAIAYAVVGEGPPLLFARGTLLRGLEDEIARSTEFWPALTGSRSVVLWDVRGGGLSGNAPEAEFDDWLTDLGAVADAACGDRFDIIGQYMSCHIAMAYAAREPERVNRMVLHSPGPAGASTRQTQPAWLFALALDNWHDFVDILALRIHTWERADAAQRWADRIRTQFTPAQFLRHMDVVESMDGTVHARSISAPTLVVDDRLDPLWGGREAAKQLFVRQVAAAIPGAQLAVITPGDAPAVDVIQRFLAGSVSAGDTHAEPSITSGMTAILFVDIADSTSITEQLGDGAFRMRARELDASLQSIIAEAGGTAIDGKLLGDGVLATFPSASHAIEAALCCGATGETQGLRLHVGLHAGDVIREANNVFGGAVNIAARISALAAPGEVLVSRTVAELARTSAGVTFEDRGEQTLKGIADPQRIFAVRRVAGGAEGNALGQSH